jgi:hypothetical protein
VKPAEQKVREFLESRPGIAFSSAAIANHLHLHSSTVGNALQALLDYPELTRPAHGKWAWRKDAEQEAQELEGPYLPIGHLADGRLVLKAPTGVLHLLQI